MSSNRRFLVFQTAFIGDVLLALPLLQVLKRQRPDARVTMVAIPSTAPLLANHPAVDEWLVYDKRGKHSGLGGILTMARTLRDRQCDVALIPHRSLRSSLVCRLAGIPRRIGFSTSSGKVFFTDVVKYEKTEHEITRNLSLLSPLNIDARKRELPNLYPDAADRQVVDAVLGKDTKQGHYRIAVAPGSIWNTKRWPKERFVELTKLLAGEGHGVVLVGGKQDTGLCEEIRSEAGDENVLNTAGKLSLLQSADAIRRCRAAVSNDSAPMHMAVAVRTPVVAIFGATVPEFGFAPLGERDVVVQTMALPCRPCSIHGGNHCPIRTFVCMKDITAQRVFGEVKKLLSGLPLES